MELVSAFRVQGESEVAARARLLTRPLADPALQAAVGPRDGGEAVLGAACPTAIWHPPDTEEARVLAELTSLDHGTSRAVLWSFAHFGDWAGALAAAEKIFEEPLSRAGRHAATCLLQRNRPLPSFAELPHRRWEATCRPSPIP